MLLVQQHVFAGAEPAEVTADVVLPWIGQRGGRSLSRSKSRRLYGLDHLPTESELLGMAERWRPVPTRTGSWVRGTVMAVPRRMRSVRLALAAGVVNYAVAVERLPIDKRSLYVQNIFGNERRTLPGADRSG